MTPQPKLEGTIYTAAKEIEEAGGKCLPLQVDIRDEKSVEAAIEKTVEVFGGIDILVNNASAVETSAVEDMAVKRYDLIQSINARGTFICSKFAIPHLRKSKNPHILTIAPPLYMGTGVSKFRPLSDIFVASKLVLKPGHRVRAGQICNDTNHSCKKHFTLI